MKKFSLLLIVCFLFQGCVSMVTMNRVHNSDKNIKIEILKSQNVCSFEEVVLINQHNSNYAFRFGHWTGLIDISLAILYNIKVSPISWSLYSNIYYGFVGFTFFVFGMEYEKYEENPEKLVAWGNSKIPKCRAEYYIESYASLEEFQEQEIAFIKAILNYPPDYDISQDQNFSNFQKDFLRNNKIQTYSKDNYFYRYIHYPGGKAKFEEDFGKYLFKQQK